jgi:hypothetical protein
MLKWGEKGGNLTVLAGSSAVLRMTEEERKRVNKSKIGIKKALQTFTGPV